MAIFGALTCSHFSVRTRPPTTTIDTRTRSLGNGASAFALAVVPTRGAPIAAAATIKKRKREFMSFPPQKRAGALAAAPHRARHSRPNLHPGTEHDLKTT